MPKTVKRAITGLCQQPSKVSVVFNTEREWRPSLIGLNDDFDVLTTRFGDRPFLSRPELPWSKLVRFGAEMTNGLGIS